MRMNEKDREVLARFDAIWGRVQPECASEPAAKPETPDEPLLQTLYTELAALLDAQSESLLDVICTVLG